jgi:hypothetical protein
VRKYWEKSVDSFTSKRTFVLAVVIIISNIKCLDKHTHTKGVGANIKIISSSNNNIKSMSVLIVFELIFHWNLSMQFIIDWQWKITKITFPIKCVCFRAKKN